MGLADLSLQPNVYAVRGHKKVMSHYVNVSEELIEL
jgi:hypothetical protein